MVGGIVIAALIAGQHLGVANTPALERTSSASGTYVGKSLNRRAIPAEETIASGDGYHHWVKLERVILRLRANGQFTVAFRYYHQHLAPKERKSPSQLLDDSQHGTFSVKGSAITFVPAPKRNSRGPKPIIGTLRGDEIEVQFRVQDGDRWKTMSVLVVRDPSYW